MTRMTRFAVALAVAAGGLLAERTASAQVDCSTLPNPIYVTGSSAFVPTMNAFAAKLAMETTPSTVIYASSSSCQGATAIANSTALTGTALTYYNADGTLNMAGCNITNTTTLADLAVSDVFYASCGTQAPTQPANLADFPGPVQAMEIIVPLNNGTTTYLTAAEGHDIWGCGVAFMGPAATDGTFLDFDMAGIFVRGPTSGSQIITASAINLDPSAMMGTMVGKSGDMAFGVGNYPVTKSGSVNAIGFLGADVFDLDHALNNQQLTAVPFAATGQTNAYLVDSAQGVPDRQNVRDGHYFPWGYEHLLATVDTTTKLPTDTKAAKLIGLITGATTDPTLDYVQLEGKAGTVPLCAMAVAKADDSPGYLTVAPTPPTCTCAFQAAALGTAPSGCVACTGGADAGTGCTGGKTCQHGFCE
jgi:ABC-type phosphate transport system substrate-binding protein